MNWKHAIAALIGAAGPAVVAYLNGTSTLPALETAILGAVTAFIAAAFIPSMSQAPS